MDKDSIRGIGLDFGATACRMGWVDGQGAHHHLAAVPLESILVRTAGWALRVDRAPTPAPNLPFVVEATKSFVGMGRKDVIEGKSMPTDDYITSVLAKAKSESEGILDLEITAVAASVPSGFTDRRRAALKACLEGAGYDQVALTDDPLAAALAYRARTGASGKWLVFALGKSAFSAAVVESGSQLTILSQRGSLEVGGDVFDMMMAKRIISSKLVGDPGEASRNSNAGTWVLWQAEALRKALSEKETVNLEGPFRSRRPAGVPAQFSLTRFEFEDMISDQVDFMMRETRDAVLQAGTDKIDRVLLVGGCCHTPIVRDRLKALWPVDQEQLDENAITQGAALYALRFQECVRERTEPTIIAEAKPQLAEAAEGKPTSAPTSMPEAASAQEPVRLPADMEQAWREARTFEQELRLNDAIDACRRFIACASEHLSFLYSKHANLLMEAKHYDLAQAKLEEGLKQYGDNPMIRASLSVLHYRKAVGAWNTMAEVGPGSGLGRQKYTECAINLRKAVEYDRGNKEAARLKEQLEAINTRRKR